MSIPVELQTLADVIARYRCAYLMTSSDQGPPHAVQVVAGLQGGDLLVRGVGRRTREYASARPAVGLLWPPASEADHTLIVDGRAAVTADVIRITPTRAVLHRPAPRPGPTVAGSCGSDCVELGLGVESGAAR